MKTRSHASTPVPRPVTIAHRGASGYLPEHSLAAKALAHAMGADFIEQDIVATADDELIVLHDIHLEQVTDVAQRFADRSRDDGRYYARDFTLAEIKQLRLRERVDADGKPVFASRFPTGFTPFAVPTLAEELALIRGLNRSRQSTTGIYPEIKKPEWHRNEGVDIAPLLLEILETFGYPNTPNQVWLQCFDLAENDRLRQHWAAPYRLVQLIGEDSWNESTTRYAELLSPGGLTPLKGTVDGIGPWIPHLVIQSDGGDLLGTHLIEEAHALELEVHPYTLRADALPSGFNTLEELLAFLTREGIDGVFCDFPDRAVAFFDNHGFAV
ncbi:MAG: glycerophosphodiester phosphodiesterase [Pseudomonadota bacterium]